MQSSALYMTVWRTALNSYLSLSCRQYLRLSHKGGSSLALGMSSHILLVQKGLLSPDRSLSNLPETSLFLLPKPSLCSTICERQKETVLQMHSCLPVQHGRFLSLFKMWWPYLGRGCPGFGLSPLGLHIRSHNRGRIGNDRQLGS